MINIFKKKHEFPTLTEKLNQIIEASRNLINLRATQTVDNLFMPLADQLTDKYTNQYITVQSLNNRYNGVVPGQLILPALVDKRAAATIGGGLDAVIEDQENERLAAFVHEFLNYNEILTSFPHKMVIQGLLDGRVLVELIYIDDYVWKWKNKTGKEITETGMIKVMYHKYFERLYRVVQNEKYEYDGVVFTSYMPENEYFDIGRLSYDGIMQRSLISPVYRNETKVLNKDNSVFLRVNGTSTDLNIAAMSIGRILNTIDRVEEYLKDLRNLNHTYATPVTVYTTDDVVSTKIIEEKVTGTPKSRNENIFGSNLDVKFITPDMSGYEAIRAEFEISMILISNAIGIPVHWLGLTSLLSNRATATSLIDQVTVTIALERELHVNFWKEVIEKSIDIFDINKGTGKSKVKVVIPPDSIQQWEKVKQMLELYKSKAISLKTFLENVPDIDAEQEYAKIMDDETGLYDIMQRTFDDDDEEKTGSGENQDEKNQDEKNQDEEKINNKDKGVNNDE